MGHRRVVAAHSPEGKAIVASDTEVESWSSDLFPGFAVHELWAAAEPPTYPDDGSPLRTTTWFPPAGGFRFIEFTVPPDDTPGPDNLDVQAAAASMEEHAPGLIARMEPENPGFHTSDTVDVFYVVSGSAVLELDDGVQIELTAGDTLVQSGTRHAWRNPSSEPCRLVGVLVGAHRSAE